MCQKEGCRTPEETRQLSTSPWVLNGTTVSYCLSQTHEEHCKLQFSVQILVAVIICNAIKCAAMFCVAWHHRETTFITFGDAIASWLDNPDPATAGRCSEGIRSAARKPNGHQAPQPQPIRLATHRWKHGVSIKRWITTILILTVALLTSCACLGLTVAQMKRSTPDTIVSLGFGVVNANMLFNGGNEQGSGGLASSVLFANMPQVILSLVYLSLNAFVTCMLLADEYSRYEVHRRPLRVTTPVGKQRATYWLQLPYTYGLPLIATSATLHWLISQSLFLVRVESYSEGKPYESYEDSGNSSSAVGLSPAPMLAVVVLGTCITAITLGMGFRKLRGRAMPVAASCSFALAAASHRPLTDVDAAVLPVRWGEVAEMGTVDVGHCCFTSQEVVHVVPGRKYAGVVDKGKKD